MVDSEQGDFKGVCKKGDSGRGHEKGGEDESCISCRGESDVHRTSGQSPQINRGDCWERRQELSAWKETREEAQHEVYLSVNMDIARWVKAGKRRTLGFSSKDSRGHAPSQVRKKS